MKSIKNNIVILYNYIVTGTLFICFITWVLTQILPENISNNIIRIILLIWVFLAPIPYYKYTKKKIIRNENLEIIINEKSNEIEDIKIELEQKNKYLQKTLEQNSFLLKEQRVTNLSKIQNLELKIHGEIITKE